ncbi:MAG TPA: hypothetical protein ACFYD7_00430 [Candidatus Wujingus californicus]|uniref:hypothetical protein n=1 Tax=Candidatus Wujingus californicus TaxID=3367618 RepID=UPI001D790F3D|nr:hypothetical protein [Planctomycetota bacterium]MDO8131416.1 hypothetical protein [Candidatus Brocadiales bacterium]
MTYANYSQCLVTDREKVSAFSPSSYFPVGTAQERMPDREFENKTHHSQIIPLWTVATRRERYRVSKPLKVRIYSEDGLFFAENDSLVIIGTGDSIQEAMNDFFGHVVHFYNYYKRLSWNKVTGDALRLKNLYETLFSEQE